MSLVVDNKRKPEGEVEDAALVLKKPRNDEIQIHANPNPERTSSLEAPTMQLTGHKAEVFSVKFSPNGRNLASGSFDKEIFLWNISDCSNYNVLRGHGGAILELHWTADNHSVVSCSTDKMVHLWDADSGKRIKRFREHTNIVNSCCPARRGSMLVSGSDDSTARVWDTRVRGSVNVITHKFPVTSVAIVDGGAENASAQPHQVITGGLDNDIRVWDLRKGTSQPLFTLQGHTDTITGLRLSPDGSYVLSNGMDNTVRVWDIRPFAPFQRCVKVLTGAQHNAEKILLRCSWAPDGSKVAAGSADRFVYIWDTTTRMILYKLPGHNGSVNEIDFHPTEPIVASCSSDKTIFLGEISA